ncbi:MAG: pyridoxal-dependent decarboxylase, partial [Planctomycetota bacterium]|nr:pyridoxal-dependent decarboxylase [Planctomycetota bacterium]
MPAPYEAILNTLRQAFPQPVSDRVHDAYFVFSFLRALDQVDALKSVTPLLGTQRDLDYETARTRLMSDSPQHLETVVADLVKHLEGMFIFGHPKSQINVVPAPTIPSIIGGLLPSIYNPNLVSDESSRQVAVAEVEVSAMSASLVGYDPQQAAGIFTFGGTSTLLYGLKIGLEKACPGTMHKGISEPAVVLCSEQAHYACRTAVAWLGLGEDRLVEIPSTPDNEIRPCLLESELRRVLNEGTKIAGIVATMGTTDAFGLDDLKVIHQLRDDLVHEYSLDYVPHIHADAVIGWAWRVFNDYDFESNPLGFRNRTVRALAGVQRRIEHLHLADSIGIDFHKTGFAPYVSSLFLIKDAHELQLIAKDPTSTPYLFHAGKYHPGKYTLETTRSGAGPLAALANLALFGKDGLRALLGHLVSMAELLREHLEGHSSTFVLNRGNFGPVTLFRV